MSVLKLVRKSPPHGVADARLVLPFELRSRSRLRAELGGGEAVGVMLERGQSLRDGDQLQAEDGRIIEIVAASESVSTVRCDDPWQLARAAYHLGNRHVKLQLGAGWLRYQHDHVLDEMVMGLGLTVIAEHEPFEPEAGAYHQESGAAPHAASHHHHHHD
jgi:urease accessory protein